MGAWHQPLPARRHRRAMGAARSRQLPCPGQRHRPPLCVCAARIAGAPGARSGPRGLVLPPAGRHRHACSRTAPAGRTRLHLLSGQRLPGAQPGQDAAPHRHLAPRSRHGALLAFRIRRQCVFAPHDPQHHGLPGVRGLGCTPSRVDARGDARPKPRRRRPDLRTRWPVFRRAGLCARMGAATTTPAFDWLP